MKEIQLTQDRVALVDGVDYERLNRFKWFAHKGGNTFYAYRWSPRNNGKRHLIQMHHEIIGVPPKGYETDHRNGDGLRNTRENLRHVTHRQNCQNRKNGKAESEYPGVSWDRALEKWIAMIQISGKRKFLGSFIDEPKAFEAYRKAVEANGETVI